MGAADRLEDGFPHGTPDGYRQGCKGSHCPEGDAGRLSCAQAYTRYQSDYGYRRRVDQGMSPVELWEFDEKVAVEKRKLVAAAPSSAPEPEPVAIEPVLVAGIPLEKHGTRSGYSAGCRLGEECPGMERVGKSCANAVSEYQRKMKARRRAEQSPAVAGIDGEVEPSASDLRRERTAAVGRAVAAEAELAKAREQIATLEADRARVVEEATRDLRVMLDDAQKQVERLMGALAAAHKRGDDLAAERAQLVDRVAALEMELDVAKASALKVTGDPAGAVLSRPQLMQLRPEPQRFRFHRDEAGGVTVDVDGPTPGFVRFEVDAEGALVGVAVQSGQ